jgi:opacity protein-like surface antigen
MKFARLAMLAILGSTFLLFGAGRTEAQYGFGTHHDIDITALGGTKFGGSIGFNPPATFTPTEGSPESVDKLPIKSSFDYGGAFDYGIWNGFDAEFKWIRQPTELRAHNVDTGETSDVGPAAIDSYQWGFLWDMRDEEAHLIPFTALGLGFTHFGTNGALTDFSNRFSYSVGGGLKYNLTKHVGLRLDVRYAPSRTTQSNAIYETEFGAVQQTVNNHANQGEANIGVFVHF